MSCIACAHKTCGCPLFKWMDIFEKKWSIRIVRELYKQNSGFNELKNKIPGITQGVLSQRLDELQQQGILAKKTITEKPLTVEYSLDEKAKQMLGCWLPENQPMVTQNARS